MSQRSVELSSRYVAVAVGIPVVEEIDDPWHGLAQDPTQLSERAGLITWGAFGSMWEHVWEHEANFSALFFAREENRVLVSWPRRAPRRRRLVIKSQPRTGHTVGTRHGHPDCAIRLDVPPLALTTNLLSSLLSSLLTLGLAAHC